MRLFRTDSWTISFFRDWWAHMTPLSVLRMRNYEIRRSRRILVPNGLISLTVTSPLNARILLREVGSDQDTFHEIVKDEIYKTILRTIPTCATIVDLGANIGLASLYLTTHYPGSRLLAVEPNAHSYRLLTENLRTLTAMGRCKTLHAAVWGCNVPLAPADNIEANHYSAFALRELTHGERAPASLFGLTMQDIIRCSGFETIDILKVDIEGAEDQLFKGELDWLMRVRSIAIEFHRGSRQTSNFDAIMARYQFRVLDTDPHTTLAVKDDL